MSTVSGSFAPSRSPSSPLASAAPDQGAVRSGAVTSDAPHTIPGTLLLAALSAVTAISFCRLFSGWDFLGPMLAVVLGVHLVSFVLRLFAAPGYIAIPAVLVVVFILLAWKYYPGTMTGPFPTSRTWTQIVADLRLARGQFPSAVAPVAAVGGFSLVATASVAFAAMLSDAFAFRAYGRAEAVVPTAVLFLFAAALGADRNRVAVTAAWLACAFAVVAVLRITHAQVEHTWIGSTRRVLVSVIPVVALLAGSAAAAGAWLGPQVPGAGKKGLVDTRQHNDVTQVLSPLVDIRSRLVNLSDTELFTVASSEAAYWRATGLTLFDGSTWKLPDGDLAAVSGNFAGAPADSHEVVQQIHITGLGGSLLPAAYSPVRVEDGSVFWVSDTGTLVVPNDGLQRAANYTIVSSVLDVNPDQLAVSGSSQVPSGSMTELPSDFPPSVAQAAIDVTAGASTTYAKALALQNWFRSQFAYDLTVQRGHSNDALENFLRTKRGYCEQFSGAFASMARSLGIPARVAVGFTPGDLGADGRYHVYGRNAHAWPEVWFDNVGWVAFEPTPGRGEPGSQQYTGVPPQQADATTAGGVTPVTTPVSTPATVESGITTTTISASGTSTTTATTTAATIAPAAAAGGGDTSGGMSALLIALAVAAVIAALWALLLPKAMTRARRGHAPRSPVHDIRRSWIRANEALGLLGLAPLPNETPTEHAARAGIAPGIDLRVLRELAQHATAAIYGDIGDHDVAVRCAELSSEVVQAVRDLLGGRDRVLSWFDPKRARVLLQL